jgi:hypothetical protein
MMLSCSKRQRITSATGPTKQNSSWITCGVHFVINQSGTRGVLNIEQNNIASTWRTNIASHRLIVPNHHILFAAIGIERNEGQRTSGEKKTSDKLN